MEEASSWALLQEALGSIPSFLPSKMFFRSFEGTLSNQNGPQIFFFLMCFHEDPWERERYKGRRFYVGHMEMSFVET